MVASLKKNALLLSGLLLVSQLGHTSAKLDSRLGYADKLIYSSHGAKQVMASDNAEAKQLQEEAKELFRQANAATTAEDARGLLDQALKKMIKAISMARLVKNKEDKQRKDFNHKAESVKALLTAYERIAVEKGQQNQYRQLAGEVGDLNAKSQALFDKGDYLEARKVLDSGYVMVKTAIENIRRGDTLVRSLNFATKEEEYHYEVDRNDTHKMLIKVLLQKKELNSYISDRIKTFQDNAKMLRDEADAYAQKGDYEKSIEVMDLSTKELVKAIRAGGIYIPG